jgi:predicted flap endonuclease-1-like 5' DNA nuclease
MPPVVGSGALTWSLRDGAMNPIGERVLWFVLGLAVGWLSGWLVFGFARRKSPAADRPPQPAAAAPAPVPEPSGTPPEPEEAVASSRVIDVGAARAAGFNMKHADDLTVIDGIGPKIDDLFHANGVDTLAQVARLSVQDMLEILERGGPSFQFANPATWAQQAALAAENRWKELKRLQEEMIEGRIPG